jgi:hypothetical protein
MKKEKTTPAVTTAQATENKTKGRPVVATSKRQQ